MELILEETEAFYAVAAGSVQGRSRTRTVLMARQAAMYLARELTDQPLATIGLFFGRRSHATVLTAVRTAERLSADNERFAQDLRALRKSILAASRKG